LPIVIPEQDKVQLGNSRITPRETYSSSVRGMEAQYQDSLRHSEQLVNALSSLTKSVNSIEENRLKEEQANAEMYVATVADKLQKDSPVDQQLAKLRPDLSPMTRAAMSQIIARQNAAPVAQSILENMPHSATLTPEATDAYLRQALHDQSIKVGQTPFYTTPYLNALRQAFSARSSALAETRIQSNYKTMVEDGKAQQFQLLKDYKDTGQTNYNPNTAPNPTDAADVVDFGKQYRLSPLTAAMTYEYWKSLNPEVQADTKTQVKALEATLLAKQVSPGADFKQIAKLLNPNASEKEIDEITKASMHKGIGFLGMPTNPALFTVGGVNPAAEGSGERKLRPGDPEGLPVSYSTYESRVALMLLDQTQDKTHSLFDRTQKKKGMLEAARLMALETNDPSLLDIIPQKMLTPAEIKDNLDTRQSIVKQQRELENWAYTRQQRIKAEREDMVMKDINTALSTLKPGEDLSQEAKNGFFKRLNEINSKDANQVFERIHKVVNGLTDQKVENANAERLEREMYLAAAEGKDPISVSLNSVNDPKLWTKLHDLRQRIAENKNELNNNYYDKQYYQAMGSLVGYTGEGVALRINQPLVYSAMLQNYRANLVKMIPKYLESTGKVNLNDSDRAIIWYDAAKETVKTFRQQLANSNQATLDSFLNDGVVKETRPEISPRDNTLGDEAQRLGFTK